MKAIKQIPIVFVVLFSGNLWAEVTMSSPDYRVNLEASVYSDSEDITEEQTSLLDALAVQANSFGYVLSESPLIDKPNEQVR